MCRTQFKFWMVPTALCLAVGTASAQTGRPVERLDSTRALLRAAPRLVDYLAKQDARSVGVLKFFVTGPGLSNPQGSLNVGPINYRLAEETEKVLLYALAAEQNRQKTPPRLIRQASRQVALKAPGAGIDTPKQRQLLFAPDYDMAWGQPRQAKADLFLVGFAHIAAHRRTMDVSLYAIGRDHPRERVVSFQAVMRPADLADSGVTLRLRGIADAIVLGDVSVGSVSANAQDELKIESGTLSKDELQSAPVRLEILYNDAVQPIDVHHGHFVVSEPKEGDRVGFRLTRQDDSPSTYAVVLKINGINTCAEQTLSVAQCRKWVLDAGDGPLVVDGFYHPSETSGGPHRKVPFRVMPAQESQEREQEFGAEVGQISFSIFKQAAAQPQPAPTEARQRDELVRIAAVEKGELLDQPSEDAVAARNAFESRFLRGLIDKDTGAVSDAQLITVIRPGLQLERSITILYRGSLPPGIAPSGGP